MRLLIAEDEAPLARVLKKLLEKSRFTVDVVGDGAQALAYLASGAYDAAILDVMMPKLDGVEVVRSLRAQNNPVPVLMLTAKAELDDRVTGLESGADYYLAKPFEAAELVAALHAITRSHAEVDGRLAKEGVTLDRTTFRLSGPEGSLELPNKEFQVLEYLMAHPGRIVSADQLRDRLWDASSAPDISVVWAYISYLRKKLALVGAPFTIKSLRNVGYSLQPAVPEDSAASPSSHSKDSHDR